MDASVHDKGVLLFGAFRLDGGCRQLTFDGTPIKLSHRQLEALLYLAENAGRVVEKDELLAAVWPGRVVEENNLSQTILVIRRALQACEPADRSIQTVPGRGYRFVAPVARETKLVATVSTQLASPAHASAVMPQQVPLRIPAYAWRNRAAAGAVMLALFAAIVWRANAPETRFTPPPRSIAVLAFTSMTGNAADADFADGLSEEMIDTLTRVPDLQVAARTSSFAFKGRPMTVADIARQLNVGAILEGSIRRQGAMLRVTAQLINATTGFHYWSHSYDRAFGDVLAVQTDIAGAVATTLQLTLSEGEAGRLAPGGTHNEAAFDAYLRGMKAMRRSDEAGSRDALAAFGQALALDPNFAEAHAARARALTVIATCGTTTDVAVVRAELTDALAEADRAVALAPALGAAHAMRADVLEGRLDFAAADAEMQRARALSPGDVAVMRETARLELALGHAEAAIAAARRAVVLDPLSTESYGTLADTLYKTRHDDEALATLGHVQSLEGPMPHIDRDLVGYIHLDQGKLSQAQQDCMAAETIDEVLCLVIAYHGLGRGTDAAGLLARLHNMLGDNGAYEYAEAAAQMGDAAGAMRWLDEAVRLRDTDLVAFRTDPLLDPIRQSAAFNLIAARLSYPR